MIRELRETVLFSDELSRCSELNVFVLVTLMHAIQEGKNEASLVQRDLVMFDCDNNVRTFPARPENRDSSLWRSKLGRKLIRWRFED